MVGDTLREVEPARRSSVAIDAIVVSQRQWQRENRRPRALTARDALVALQFEALLVWTAAGNLRQGIALTDEDFLRLTQCCSRLNAIVDEAV